MAMMEVLQGLGVSEGVAIGRSICLESRIEEIFRIPLPEGEIEEEVERFQRACDEARAEVRELRERVGSELGEELAGIFEAHGMLLGDVHLVHAIEGRIRDERVNAEWAVWEAIAELRHQFARLDHERFRERGDDIQDIGRQLIRSLRGISYHELSEVSGDVVVVADDLTPSDAVRLGRQGAVGFALEAGGRTSHTAIIAHSLNIPLVTGLPGVTRLTHAGGTVIIDGRRGRVVLHPTDEMLAEYREIQAAETSRVEALSATRTLRPVTRDGVELHLLANVDLLEEVDDARRLGAEGIGLYRSEFLYIEKSPALPAEEDHYRTYRELLEAFAPHSVTIRTFDLGGKKLAREVLETREDNPVLGLRGIRLTLARPDVFRSQLRGLLRAARHGVLRILLPLVSTLDEVRKFKAFLDAVADDLTAEGIEHAREVELGVMIEVPSAALIADHLAREVDFFSIGTNDLIQYAIAVDRNNEHVTDLYQPLHPGLLRMLYWVVRQADEVGIPVTVCGETAGDPVTAAVLVGLGVRHLSMSPRRIPAIKTMLRELDVRALAARLDEARDLPTADDVRQHLEGFVPEPEPATTPARPVSD